MKAAVLTIGTELLIGQVVDTNSTWLGLELNALGIEVLEKRSISDDREMIMNTIDDLSEKVSFIFITGGLGPTKDDITKKTIADLLGLGMEFHEETFTKISNYFKGRNIPIKEAHRLQCYMPIGAILLTNNMGTAPGMWLEYKDTVIVSMPGVPSEMKYIFNNDLKAKLQADRLVSEIFHRTIHTAGIGETMIADLIPDIESNLPKGISLAYLPGIAQVRVRISGNPDEDQGIKEVVMQVAEQIESRISKYVFGYDGETLPMAIMKLLKPRNEKLTLAESCTGGYVSHLMVSTPGISEVYDGGLTTYSYELKEKILGVQKATLTENGAVSEEVVREMVLGAIKTTGSDYCIAISGIAGPGGGTPDKPVGTVWVAYGNEEEIKTKKLQLTKNREMNIKYSAAYALNAFRRLLVAKK